MIAMVSGPLPLSVEIFVLALFLVLDIGLLADFLRFIWKETRSPISVLRSFLFFKATTVPIILGTLIGFYKFIRKDVSLLNKIKAAPDIVDTNITYHPKK
jgi:hypothetical protein